MSMLEGLPMAADTLRRRWRGQPGRLEVWYLTATDPVTGTGLWTHAEMVSPTDSEPYLHGWVAVFPPGGEPIHRRFGPAAAEGAGAEAALSGAVDGASWDLHLSSREPPLYTFGRRVWERQLLPAAQIVPVPSGRVSGEVTIGSERLRLDGAPGALAHIYGHGNASRWCWLHADLGDGEVLELVSAVARRRGLNRLPPATLVQLRHGGRDWPATPLIAAAAFRASIGLPEWRVTGRVGGRRLEVTVRQPPERSLRLRYVDPDGARATCTNSETADADIVLYRRSGRTWEIEKQWSLSGTAHAEVGDRLGYEGG
ncbi:MAG TPA: hypothetical protein VFH58_15680 [Acidimicrobiales bacterium]|nr:hypothetical protein [Acidimicrobiales bacterium]